MTTVRGKSKFAYGAVVAMAVTGIGVLPAHAAPTPAKAPQQQPSATYDIKTFDAHHPGGPHGVNGISWYIGNKRCKPHGKGTNRTQLFIHSEMLPSGKPGSSEPYRWDGNSDYKSNGCIKLKPADARDLMGYRSNYPHPGKLYVS